MAKRRLKIYVASSWRNKYQPTTVLALRGDGHLVYDFRNPKEGDFGFSWTDVGLSYHPTVSPKAWKEALEHPIAKKAFENDFGGMKWADCCVLVMPCGRSAHAEAGWFAGQGKKVFALVLDDAEPDLMYKMFAGIATSATELLKMINESRPKKEDH